MKPRRERDLHPEFEGANPLRRELQRLGLKWVKQ